jgi:hypothetical protein
MNEWRGRNLPIRQLFKSLPSSLVAMAIVAQWQTIADSNVAILNFISQQNNKQKNE